jgi:gliding motility-associated-like protein
MKAYIHKYKLAFLFLFLLISGIAKGQNLYIDSMVYTTYDKQYIFACRKATPIDLFKAANLYVSPEYGYWGDVYGAPYNGKPGTSSNIKERQYTNGNIFTPPTSEADTGMYKFYFYFTSTKDYCGINKNTRFILNLHLGTYGCMEGLSGELDNTHIFCYGSSEDMNGRHTFEEPVTIADLLMTYADEPINWKQNRMMNSDWVPVDVYTDREHRNRIGDGKMEVNLLRAYDTTFYVIIHHKDGEYSDSVNIRVYPESKLNVYYRVNDALVEDLKVFKEYNMDDQITIRVDTSEYKFKYYWYLLNNKDMNKYFLGSDSTKNEIVLSALAFTGVDDILKISAKDINNCIVRDADEARINIPFPSVFTPDGDGINDVFFGGEKFRNREFHLEISNRWGSLLYSGESGWDGTYRGNKTPPGTYLYVLILKLEDGTSRTVTGTVTLIREGQ